MATAGGPGRVRILSIARPREGRPSWVPLSENSRAISPRSPSGPGPAIHPVYRLPRTMTTQARVCSVRSSGMLAVAPPYGEDSNVAPTQRGGDHGGDRRGRARRHQSVRGEGLRRRPLGPRPRRSRVAAKEVERAGGRSLGVPTDVADAEQVEAAAECIERELGEIDVWVNDAMTSVFAPFREMTPEEFRRVTEVTYLGQVYGTMAALKRMLPRNRGAIVFVGSALAYRGIPLQWAYCGAKHATRGLIDWLGEELLTDRSR